LLFGTSNTNGIKAEKLSQSVEITKSTAFTLDQAAEQIPESQTKPDVVLLHALTNDIKNYTPEKCVEKLQSVVDLITSKWENTKTIVSLTTPRNDHEMHSVNSEILDGLIKRQYLS